MKGMFERGEFAYLVNFKHLICRLLSVDELDTLVQLSAEAGIVTSSEQLPCENVDDECR